MSYQSDGYKKLNSESERVVYIHEYKTQLKNQQDAINEMNVATMRRNIGNLGDGKLVRADNLAKNKFRSFMKSEMTNSNTRLLRKHDSYSVTSMERRYPREKYLFMNDEEYDDFILDAIEKVIYEHAFDITNEYFSNKDVLHNPDKIIGGLRKNVNETRAKFKLGNNSINRSIGSSWNQGRAGYIENEIEDVSPDLKMNVELKICPP